MVEIQNLVKVFMCGCDINLIELSKTISQIDYRKERFNGAILKMSNPKGCLLIFRNGKIVVTGVKSEQNADECIFRFFKMIGNIVSPRILYSEVVNLTAKAKIPFDIDAKEFVKTKNCTWYPELFPGMYWQERKDGPLIIFYYTGSVIITGCKHEHELYCAYDNFLIESLDFVK
jgi:transcription initiation factor TFIID TATA-box-binding protein